MRINQDRLHERGFALITTMVFSVSMAFMVASFLGMNSGQMQEVKGRMDSDCSFWFAEAGLHKAQWLIMTPPAQGGEGLDYYTTGRTETMDDGQYTLVIKKTGLERLITSTGTYRGLSRTVQQKFTVKSQSRFDHSIFGAQRIYNTTIGTLSTDSYNSRQTPMPSRFKDKGSIGVNTTAPAVINLQGPTSIKGDAVIGPNGNVNTAIYTRPGYATIAGVKYAATAPKDLPAVQVPPGLTCRPLQLYLSGNTTMPGGNYCFNYFYVYGSGQITFLGPTNIYVTNYMYVFGNYYYQYYYNYYYYYWYRWYPYYNRAMPSSITMTANTYLPKDLNIQMTNTSVSNYLQGLRLYGTIYNASPNSSIFANISGYRGSSNDIYGGVVIGNFYNYYGTTQVHYDEALGTGSANGSQLKSVDDTWLEIFPSG